MTRLHDRTAPKALAALAALTLLAAQEPAPVPTTPVAATEPRPLVDATGTEQRTIEASAVAPIGDGRLWLVAHDKQAPLVVVEAATGRVLDPALTGDAFPSGLKVGPKWEAMARDDQGFLYVIGSHSGTDAERAERAFLVRFRIGGSPEAPVIEPGSARRWHVDAGLVAALNAQGLETAAIAKRKIEGLAVRTRRDAGGRVTGRQLVVGLREPDDRVRVYQGDIAEPPAADATLAVAPLFSFDAGHRDGERLTLTSLERLEAWGGGYLVLTSTEDATNGFHGNVLWFVPDAAIGPDGQVAAPRALWTFAPTMKAEGLAVLATAADGRVDLAVAYDNDASKTRQPSRVQTLSLSRPGR